MHINTFKRSKLRFVKHIIENTENIDKVFLTNKTIFQPPPDQIVAVEPEFGIKRFDTTERVWHQLPIQYGEFPNENWEYYANHHYLTHMNKFMIFGGFVGGPTYYTEKCFAFHISTGELEEIPGIGTPCSRQTLQHLQGSPLAYIVGGESSRDKEGASNECLKYNLEDHKCSYLASLNYQRFKCGAFQTDDYLIVYGGNNYNHSDWVSQIERLNLLNPEEGFSVIDVQNSYLLEIRNTVAFKCDDRIGIFGQQNDHLLWYDPKENKVTESKIQKQSGDSFEHNESGFEEDGFIYLTGSYHMYVLDKRYLVNSMTFVFGEG